MPSLWKRFVFRGSAILRQIADVQFVRNSSFSTSPLPRRGEWCSTRCAHGVLRSSCFPSWIGLFVLGHCCVIVFVVHALMHSRDDPMLLRLVPALWTKRVRIQADGVVGSSRETLNISSSSSTGVRGLFAVGARSLLQWSHCLTENHLAIHRRVMHRNPPAAPLHQGG